MADQHPELTAASAYSEALNRHTPLLTAFERGLRIIDEMFQRLEREMYAGMGYSNEAMGPDGPKRTPGPTKGFIDKKLADCAVSLSRALSQAGAVHARLLSDENARADRLSETEKIAFMLSSMRSKPMSIRQTFAEALLKP